MEQLPSPKRADDSDNESDDEHLVKRHKTCKGGLREGEGDVDSCDGEGEDELS
jgi:hypothetical protein